MDKDTLVNDTMGEREVDLNFQVLLCVRCQRARTKEGEG
jgi:hypothetical protein